MRGHRVRAANDGNRRNGLVALIATVVVVAALILFAGSARAQSNAIESVTAVHQGAATVMRITMKQPPKAVPGSFSISNPPRLAFDFPETSNGMNQSLLELAQGEARSLNVVQAGSRSRMVLNLR